MRLVCPNCEAKYEVPEDAIPETGRDVQCANCGHAWYQMRPRAAAVETAAPVAAPASALVPERVPEPEPAQAPEAVTAPEPVVEVAAEAEPDPVAETPAVEEMVPEPSLAETEPVDVAPVAEEPASPEAALDAEPVPETAAVVESDAVAESEAVVGPPQEVPDAADAPIEASGAAVPEAAADEDKASDAPIAAAAAGAAAYAVDDSVLAILREEAEREAQARRAEIAKPLEIQPDLGIEQAIPASRQASEPLVEDASQAVRRTRLPDVEEINSTLRPSDTVVVEDLAPEPVPVAAEGRSSFRSGFLLVMTVAILGSAIYGSADAIAQLVPALEGPLKGYVGFVDSLRLQLDGLMQSATVAINGT